MSSLISTAISIFSIVCMWMVFEKAGEPGWQAIIPIWNAWVLAKIANKRWTFWVQMIGSGIMTIGLIACTFLMFSTMNSNSYYTDDHYSDNYYDEYDYYEEEDHTSSELSNAKDSYKVSNLAMSDYYEYDEDDYYSDDDYAAMEDSLDTMIAEMGESIGFLLLAFLIPFLIVIPMMVINFIQNMGLSQAFGQHWAFAFLLTLVKPVGMGILAFSDTCQYVGNGSYDYTPSPAAAAGSTYAAQNYRPVEHTTPAQPVNTTDYHASGYQSTDYNPFEPSSNARLAPDVSEMPLRQQDTTPQVRHRCPSCGYESDRAPTPDTFCPNCGRLFR